MIEDRGGAIGEQVTRIDEDFGYAAGAIGVIFHDSITRKIENIIALPRRIAGIAGIARAVDAAAIRVIKVGSDGRAAGAHLD